MKKIQITEKIEKMRKKIETTNKRIESHKQKLKQKREKLAKLKSSAKSGKPWKMFTSKLILEQSIDQSLQKL